MKELVPDFYSKFKCIASQCTDSCCIGWEIDIDSRTSNFYRSIDGTFADSIEKNIAWEEPPHFILTSEERCPFLNKDNLCEIFIHLGEEHLCEICTEHPRFHEWFGDYKESGLGLCCEEAVRLLYSQDHPLTFTLQEIDEQPDEADFDQNILQHLLNVRTHLFHILQNDQLCFAERLKALLHQAELIQELLDNEEYDALEKLITSDPPKISPADFSIHKTVQDISYILSFLTELEPIDPQWPHRLDDLAKQLPVLTKLESCEPLREYEHLAVYFLFRYFLKGIWDGDILSRTKLAVLAPLMIRLLAKQTFSKTHTLSIKQRIDNTKAFSKEIEYCEENLEALLCKSWEVSCLSVETLCNMADCLFS